MHSNYILLLIGRCLALFKRNFKRHNVMYRWLGLRSLTEHRYFGMRGSLGVDPLSESEWRGSTHSASLRLFSNDVFIHALFSLIYPPFLLFSFLARRGEEARRGWERAKRNTKLQDSAHHVKSGFLFLRSWDRQRLIEKKSSPTEAKINSKRRPMHEGITWPVPGISTFKIRRPSWRCCPHRRFSPDAHNGTRETSYEPRFSRMETFTLTQFFSSLWAWIRHATMCSDLKYEACCAPWRHVQPAEGDTMIRNWSFLQLCMFRWWKTDLDPANNSFADEKHLYYRNWRTKTGTAVDRGLKFR